MARFVLLAFLSLAWAMPGCSLDGGLGVTGALGLDPEIELDDIPDLGQEGRLARLINPVDTRLMDLLRVTAARNSYPDEEWIAWSRKQFPWISGIALVNMQGEVVARSPETPMKPLDFAVLTEDGKTGDGLRGYVQRTALGPEIILANPMRKENSTVGLVVVHFDPRKLVAYSPDPARLLFFAPETMLWNGRSDKEHQALLEAGWEDILKDDVHGSVEAGERSYTWLMRYAGDKKLIYAVENTKE